MLWRAVGPILVGVVVGFVFAVLAPERATAEFYSAASQIIPVLMLALTVESRVFTAALRSPLPPPRRPLGRIAQRLDPYVLPLVVGAVLVLMCLGELVALATIGNAHYRTADPFSVYFILGFGAAAVATIPLWNLPTRSANHPNPPDPSSPSSRSSSSA
jgi:hypothetical protein